VEFIPARFGRLPLRSLAVFEAAARHGKFAAAAGELAMTQAGVSQHIAQLESELGVVLFHRRHRGVQLTDAGAKLLDAATDGLHTLARGVAEARRAGSGRTVNILTDFGFAAWWLMPRIAELSELMPQVEIRLVTSQGGSDIGEPDFDLAVLFGGSDWPGCRARRLFAERVYPVCAPAYAQAPLAPAQIADLRLLHLRHHGAQRWFEWDDWFAGMGITPPRRQQELVFSNYQIVLQAVLLGQGVALGWAPLIDELIANGSLIRLCDTPLTSARGYHLIEPLRAAGGTNHAARVADWLWQAERGAA